MIFSPKLQLLLKKIVVISVTLTVAVFVLNVLADNPYSHRLVRTVINDKVTTETNLDVDFQAVKMSAIPFGVDLYGLSVTPQGDSTTMLFKASHIKARVSLWSIIIGEPRLGLVEAHDPEVRWPLPESFKGIMKEPAAKRTESGPFRWPLKIDPLPVNIISLKNARVYAEIPDTDPQAALPLLATSIKGLDLTANISDLSEIELYILAKDIHLQIEEKVILNGTEFETDIILSDDKLHKSPFRVLSEYLDFGGIIAGKFDRSKGNILEAIDLNIEFDGKGDIAHLGMVFDIPKTKGPVAGHGTAAIHIPVEAVSEPRLLISAEARSDGAQIREFNLFQTNAHVDIDLDKLTISDANIRIGETVYGNASGTIGFDSSVPIDFQGTPKGLPLTKLLSALTVDFDAFEAGVTSNNLTIKGTGDPLQLSVNAISDFDNLHSPELREPDSANRDLPTCRIAVNLDINRDRLAFDGTDGSCFIYAPTSEKGVVPTDEATPPLDALFVSPIEFLGSAAFEATTGINLTVRSPQWQMPLLKEIAKVPVSGNSSIDVRTHGAYDNVVVDADVRVTNLNVFDIPLGRATGLIQIKDRGQTIAWRDVRTIFPNNGSLFSESGRIISETKWFEANLVVADAPKAMLERVFVAAGLPGTSLTIHSLDAKIQGPLLQPLAYQGSVDFYVKSFLVRDLAQFDVISGKVKLTETAIEANDLNFELKDFQIRSQIEMTRASPTPPLPVEGDLLRTLGLHPDSKLKIQAETYVSDKWREARQSPEFFFDHLQNLPIIKDIALPAKLQGRLAIAAQLQGDFNGVDGSFESTVSRTAFMGSAIAPINVKGIISNKKLDLVANHSGNALEGRISIDLSQDSLPYHWYFNANRFDMRAIGSSLFSADARNFAYLTGDWTMKGELTDWWHSEGELNIQDIRVRYYRNVRGESKVVELKDTRPVTVNFRRHGWSFAGNQDLLLDSDRFRLHVGLGNSRPPQRFNVTFDGHFDLVLLQNMSQTIETANGLVQFNGSIAGSVDDPDFSLRITHKKGSPDPVTIGLAPIRPPFTDIEFDAVYEDNKLILNSFTAKKGNGRITASGQTVFDINSGDDSRIDINLDHATVVYQVAILKSFEMELSGAIGISGSQAPFDVTGDIVVNRARSTREFDLREQIIGALQRRELDTPLVPEEPLVNLDLRIVAENSIEIYNRTIQSILSANLVVKGNNVVPVVNGQVEVNKGTFAYKYQRDFRITQGLMTFDDPVRPDPRLDILGVSEIAGYRVYLAITGRASNPKVDLSVDPPAREDGTLLTKLDILILMSTGSLPERTQNNSAASAAQAEALNILVGQFEEPVEKLFDMSGQTVVQRVYIDTYAGEDGPTPRLNLPLNLHRDWDVIFRVDENNQKVSLGYTINESISVSGSLDSQRETQNTRVNQSEATQSGPDTGVDLKFRFAFP